MTTKTKTPADVTAAELSQQVLADAQAMHASLLAQLEHAEEAQEELRSQVRRHGDTTVTGDQLTAAAGNLELAELLVQYSTEQVRRATAGLINTDLSVAEVIANVIAESRDKLGAPLTPEVVALRSDVLPAPDGTARLFVVQERAGLNDGGLVSGEVDVHFLRPAAFASLDAESIEDVCRSRGYIVEMTPRGSHRRDGIHGDELFIRVRSAYPAVPVLLSAPSQERLDFFGAGVTARVTSAVRSPNESVTSYRYAGAGPTRASGKHVKAEQVGKTTTRDGVSRMTVQVTLHATESHNYSANAQPSIAQALADHVGLAEPGTGRVESVDVVNVGVPDADRFAKRPWEVTARFVLTYRLA